jgi:hypothetical protein
LPFIDRRIGEDERVEIFEDGELGSADTIADRAGLPAARPAMHWPVNRKASGESEWWEDSSSSF